MLYFGEVYSPPNISYAKMFNCSLKRECFKTRCTEFIAHVSAVNIRAYQFIKYFMKYLLQIYFNASFLQNYMRWCNTQSVSEETFGGKKVLSNRVLIKVFGLVAKKYQEAEEDCIRSFRFCTSRQILLCLSY